MMEQDAVLADGRRNAPPKFPSGAGPRPEALGPPARSSLTAGQTAESAARQPDRRRDGAPKGAAPWKQGAH